MHLITTYCRYDVQGKYVLHDTSLISRDENKWWSNSWGPPRVKVRGGGKGSWTEPKIGMLPVVTLLCINKVKCQ